ncbi:unnamed protein product [Parnassius apollo]|uniref:(apollo) hypothetical protein n=1 Tax=Parnassius apollo TaxID=110799 RepID=A0A8S3WM38_PARAO|nr:unnamed protein product [Parnassius apollo]
MGLMIDLGSDTPPSISMQERVIAHPSPSYARAAAVSTGEPLSVTSGQKRQHVEAHRGQEAYCGDQECTLHVPNVEAVARAPLSSSSLPLLRWRHARSQRAVLGKPRYKIIVKENGFRS